MSDFLKKMKEAVEDGKFNSEIADRINEIDQKATEFAEGKSVKEMEEVVEENVGEDNVVTVEEEKMPEINSEYEQKMEEIKRVDKFNNSVVDIINLHDYITAQKEMIDGKITALEEEYGNDREKWVNEFEVIDSIKANYEN